MNKQIEEMAKVACVGFREGDCENCKSVGICSSYTISKKLYDNGYRKSSEVARETVEAIKAEARKKEQYVNDIFGYGGYVIATTDLEEIIRRYMFDTYEEAELRKKYESEGGE